VLKGDNRIFDRTTQEETLEKAIENLKETVSISRRGIWRRVGTSKQEIVAIFSYLIA